MVSQLFITQFLGTKIAFDQVYSRLNRGAFLVHRRSQSTAEPITNHRSPDTSTNGVRDSETLLRFERGSEVDAKRTTATSGGGLGQSLELPEGVNPARHLDSDRQ